MYHESALRIAKRLTCRCGGCNRAFRIVDRMEMNTTAKTPLTLANWYASEHAKRNLGTICNTIFEQDASVTLLGSEAEPLLALDRTAVALGDEEISIDEARADWSNVTLAAAIYGTRFRIQHRKSTSNRVGLALAILHRHQDARHPAERYLRSASPNVERLAQEMESLARQVRQLAPP